MFTASIIAVNADTGSYVWHYQTTPGDEWDYDAVQDLLSRYMRRWLVERFFAWIQWQRRILIRWEYHAHNFLGFVQLARLVILFKRF